MEKVPLTVCIIIHIILESLYRDDARVKSHVIRVQNVGENHSLGLQNILAIVYGPISTYTCSPRPHTHLQSSMREFAHTRFHDSCHNILHLLLL